MKISVIIPVYNESKAIKLLLESIGEIGYPKSDYEVIVVNDGSTDNTSDIVKKFPFVRLINHEKNKGRYDARKTGMENAKYENLLYIDSRALVPKEILKNLSKKKDSVIIGHSKGRDKETVFEILYSAIRRQFFRKFYREMQNRVVLTKENFDTYPKGTTIFFIKKSLFESIISKYGHTFSKDSSEDTRLFSYILEKDNIILDPDIWIINYGREDFGKSLGHIFERGIHFTDYYLKSGTLKHKLVLFFPVLAALGLGTLYWLFGIYAVFLLLVSWFSVAFYLDHSPLRALVIFALAPLAGSFFYLGVIKGLGTIIYKKIGRKRLLNLITICVLGICTYYLINNRQDFVVLKSLKYYEVLILVAFNAVLISINGLFSWYLYRQFGLSLGKIESVILSISTSFGNTFLPLRAGMGLQAVYLKKQHNFRYSYFVSTIAGVYVINFFVLGLIGIISMLIIYYTKNVFSIPVFLAFFALSAGMIFAVKSSKVVLSIIPFRGLKSKLEIVLEGWKVLSKSPRKVLVMGIITAINCLIMSTMIFLQFRFLGIVNTAGDPIMIWDSIFLSSFLVLSIFLNITPASLGIKEILLAYAATVVSINPQDAIVASVLDRIMSISILLILGPLSVYYLRRRIENK